VASSQYASTVGAYDLLGVDNDPLAT